MGLCPVKNRVQCYYNFSVPFAECHLIEQNVSRHEDESGPLPPSLHPVAREMLHEQVFAMMSQNLMVGRFAPGQKLPLRGLAQVMETSLMPVRDAMQRLESLGALVSTPARTMMVPVLNKKEQEDLIRLRVLLETEGAGAAALNRTADEIARLDAGCDAIRRSAEENDLPGFLEANCGFHNCVAEASRISFLPTLLAPLWMRVGPLVRVMTPDQSNMLRSVDFHVAIRNAIVAQDPDAARLQIAADIIESNQLV